jgi:hypothetical protein
MPVPRRSDYNDLDKKEQYDHNEGAHRQRDHEELKDREDNYKEYYDVLDYLADFAKGDIANLTTDLTKRLILL